MNYHLIRFFIFTVSSLKCKQLCIYIPVSSQLQRRRQHSILSIFWYFNLLICSRYYLICYVEILISFYSYLLLYFVNFIIVYLTGAPLIWTFVLFVVFYCYKNKIANNLVHMFFVFCFFLPSDLWDIFSRNDAIDSE